GDAQQAAIRSRHRRRCARGARARCADHQGSAELSFGLMVFSLSLRRGWREAPGEGTAARKRTTSAVQELTLTPALRARATPASPDGRGEKTCRTSTPTKS